MAAPKRPLTTETISLFQIETYKGCQVCRDRESGRDAIVVSGVKGEEIDLHFERRLDGWNVQLSVTARLPGRNRRIYQSEEITDQIRKFWGRLEQLAYDQACESEEKDQERLHAMFYQGGK